MSEIHKDKNGNLIKGAALTSHIIYTHDGGLEAHDAAVFQRGVQVGIRKGIQQYMEARHSSRRKHQSGNILQRFIKR